MPLFYREKGDPSLPPLIILHGLWGASDNWLRVAALLESRFHVILPDCRNHGHSPHLPVHDYEVLCQDVEELIRSLHLHCKPFIAGHSMGGKTLMHLLLKDPAIAAKAVVIDVAPRPYTEYGIHQRLLRFMNSPDLLSYNREELTRRIRTAFPEEKYVQLILKNIRKQNHRFTWKINVPVLTENLAKIMGWLEPTHSRYTSPVLFIAGSLSAHLTSADEPSIRALFPEARFTAVAQAGHWIHADAPEQLAHLLSAFFLQADRPLIAKPFPE